MPVETEWHKIVITLKNGIQFEVNADRESCVSMASEIYDRLSNVSTKVYTNRLVQMIGWVAPNKLIVKTVLSVDPQEVAATEVVANPQFIYAIPMEDEDASR